MARVAANFGWRRLEVLMAGTVYKVSRRKRVGVSSRPVVPRSLFMAVPAQRPRGGGETGNPDTHSGLPHTPLSLSLISLCLLHLHRRGYLSLEVVRCRSGWWWSLTLPCPQGREGLGVGGRLRDQTESSVGGFGALGRRTLGGEEGKTGRREMESPGCMGLMAVMAVSGSVAFVAVQLHRRLAAEFMEKVHLELGTGQGGDGGCRSAKKCPKKVRFAADVVEPSSNNEEYRRRRSSAGGGLTRPEFASCRS
ncbi:hypothetical protein Taro_037513 [Colocasia esculenta]|uniref:Uncharacterized protein n=1 Tax=Colocasia esculenta TaxID=4460 RepID=A0A843W5U6_COLES|nr:hypothetical protein [Colocasia esculenta]